MFLMSMAHANSQRARLLLQGRNQDPSLCDLVDAEATPEQLAELMMQVRRDFGGASPSSR